MVTQNQAKQYINEFIIFSLILSVIGTIIILNALFYVPPGSDHAGSNDSLLGILISWIFSITAVVLGAIGKSRVPRKVIAVISIVFASLLIATPAIFYLLLVRTLIIWSS